MIKLSTFVLFLLTIVASCNQLHKTSDCEMFRSGKFKLKSKLDNTYWIIDRHDSVQVETNSITGEKTTEKITWTAPCEYQLLQLTNTEKKEDSIASYYRKKPLFTKILSSTKNYYVFESTKEGISMTYIDTIWVDRD